MAHVFAPLRGVKEDAPILGQFAKEKLNLVMHSLRLSNSMQ